MGRRGEGSREGKRGMAVGLVLGWGRGRRGERGRGQVGRTEGVGGRGRVERLQDGRLLVESVPVESFGRHMALCRRTGDFRRKRGALRTVKKTNKQTNNVLSSYHLS